jgi:four helix bundle protein
VELVEWEQTVPAAIKDDTLWRMKVYRLALFAADLGWSDVTRLMQDKRTISVADQLYRALGSVSSNIAEGYGKSSGKDRVRFFEYALGSARESRDWYYKARHILGDDLMPSRIELQSQIIRLLLTIIPVQRQLTIGEGQLTYVTDDET